MLFRHSCRRGTPYRRDRAHRVSPERTVWVREGARTTSACPTTRVSPGVRPLSSKMRDMGTPYLTARAYTVSPGSTMWITMARLTAG